MSKLDNRNKELLELCRKQEKEIKELTLKLAKMEGDNKTSVPSCEQLEGIERLSEKRIVQPSCKINGELESKEYIYIKDKTLAVKKLFEIEDIEEDLGINLIMLYNVLRKGKIHVKNGYDIEMNKDVDIDVNEEYFCSLDFINDDVKNERLNPMKNMWVLWFVKETRTIDDYVDYHEIYVQLKDYGKTWALTKEELL